MKENMTAELDKRYQEIMDAIMNAEQEAFDDGYYEGVYDAIHDPAEAESYITQITTFPLSSDDAWNEMPSDSAPYDELDY